MRISDWSSDVCSSDLAGADPQRAGGIESGALGESRDRDMPRRLGLGHRRFATGEDFRRIGGEDLRRALAVEAAEPQEGAVEGEDRKSDVSGKSVSVRVALGGRSILKKKTKKII